jgi:hypothetical protein
VELLGVKPLNLLGSSNFTVSQSKNANFRSDAAPERLLPSVFVCDVCTEFAPEKSKLLS